MPAGRPINGNSIPIAAAAFGASGDSVSTGRAGADGAKPGRDAGPEAAGDEAAGASGMALSGRLHCQQAAEVGKLFAPQ